ncbi:hypothetical protein AAHN97_16055 [Chitinophaga niabensis]|uniref:hypothetical protein n=1 Tax=Chitinophaga niabensis TaxID=536979 RepID=UPI0031B9D252
MKKLDLKTLEDGHSTGLSVRYGGFLAESASVCLNHHAHPLDVVIPVEGSISESYLLSRLMVDESSKNSLNDEQEAIEYGAMGVAVALIYHCHGFKVSRSWKGTGFDFWCGEEKEGYPFENKLRLEVSGKMKGTDGELKYRLNEKLGQTTRSADMGLPACAIIVEFSTPKTLTGEI